MTTNADARDPGEQKPTRYRKRPIVIEAVRWSGLEADLPALFEFIGDFKNLPDDGAYVSGPGVGYTPPDGCVYIPTREGTMTAQPGDYIIRGVAGEFYPIKPDIFAATYEVADEG
jgi:hypothetical protein